MVLDEKIIFLSFFSKKCSKLFFELVHWLNDKYWSWRPRGEKLKNFSQDTQGEKFNFTSCLQKSRENLEITIFSQPGDFLWMYTSAFGIWTEFLFQTWGVIIKSPTMGKYHDFSKIWKISCANHPLDWKNL